MNSRQQNKNNKQSGFTLAEMLVAIGMVSILLSIGGLSLVHYQKVIKLSELDTIARKIFVVAQNNIIKAKASGEWEDLLERQQDNIDTYLGDSITQRPSDYPSGEVWPEGGKDSGHDYRYIVYSNREKTLDNTILNKILPYGAIDEHIRKEGQYVIEYDYETGNVYGVFYTDSNQTINYEIDIMSPTGLNYNKGREDSKEGREARKNYKNANNHMMIGYYGGAVENNLESARLEPLEIQVDNGDRLEIIIKDKNYGRLIDGVKAQTKLAFTVTGEESQISETKILEIGGMKTNRDSVDEGWWKAEVESNIATYTLTLDDVTKEGGHFADIFPRLIPGENITVKAEAYSEEVLCTPVKVQAYTNSLFADNYAEDALTAKVVINNIRHLKNLNPKISNIPTEKLEDEGYEKVGRIVRKAEQIKSLDLLGEDFYSIDNTALTEYEGNSYTLRNFKLQPNDKGNVGLFAQVGDEETSQNLIVKNLILEGFISETQVEGASAGTLIGEVKEGTLKAENIFVINTTVKASSKGYAGGLVGKMRNGELDQCRVYLTDEDTKSLEGKSSSKKYELGAYNATNNTQGNQYMVASNGGVAGGLVGKIENTDIKDSFTAIPVIDSSNGIVGGLVGKNSGSAGQVITITNSYASGYTIAGKYSDYYGVTALGHGGRAGGLIGQDGAHVTTVENSYSTATIYGDIVGGFVGDVYAKTSTYKNSYATGKVTGINTSSSRDGFIGKLTNTSTISIEQCYYLKQSNIDLKASISTAKGLDYEAFINATNKGNPGPNGKSSPYDQTLKNIDYPFRSVTKMGENIIHYGDWPLKDEQKVTGGDIGVLYYEIIDDKLYYHGYFADYSSNEIQPNYKEVMTDGIGLINGLVTDPNKYVSEDGYIILVPEGTDLDKIAVAVGDGKNSTGEKWTLSQCVEPFNKKDLVSIEGFDVYYFSKELNIYSLSYITIGENTNPWYPQFGDYASFCFNPFFADTVKIEKVEEEEIHIRSARHLLNMKNLEWSHSNKPNLEYIQSLDISYDGVNFTQNGKKQTYEYQTIGMISADYTVRKYNNGTKGYVIKGLEKPLFGYITSSSHIKGVTLLNSKIKNQESFASTNEGIIESCSVRAEIPDSNGYDNVTIEKTNKVIDPNTGEVTLNKISGFVGTNRGTIRNSYFVGTVIGDIVSGFVDTNQGTIENSYANAILIGTTSTSGFTYYNNGGIIRNSFVVGAVRSTGVNSVAYGFMETNESTSIMENCYAALFELSGSQIYRFGRGRGSNYSNCVWLDNTYIEGDVQIGDENDLKEQGVAMSYEDLLNKDANPITYPYRSNYEHIDRNNLVYPFKLISTNDAYIPVEFWGDWPEQELNIYEEIDNLVEDVIKEDVIEEGVIEGEAIEESIIDEGDMLEITQEPMI
nr:prepilin-type N-terminal cleavage/methylation domain-containing protein [uncultured Niameybacter sp.]